MSSEENPAGLRLIAVEKYALEVVKFKTQILRYVNSLLFAEWT